MRRERHAPRPGWQQIIASQGMCFDTPATDAHGNARPYWDESCYALAHYSDDPEGSLTD